MSWTSIHVTFFAASSLISSGGGADTGQCGLIRHVPSRVRTHSAAEMPPSFYQCLVSRNVSSIKIVNGLTTSGFAD